MWGSRAPVTATADIGMDSLMLALRDRFDGAAAGSLRCLCELHVDDHCFHATIAHGTLTVARGEATTPDIVVATDFDALKSIVFGDDSHHRDLLSSDRVEITAGDRKTLTSLAAAFGLPGC